jgi:hypothetical protein
MFVIVAVKGPEPETVPIVPVAETTPLPVIAPNSMFLSSTVRVLEFIVVVVPFTVRLPGIVTVELFAPIVMALSEFVPKLITSFDVKRLNTVALLDMVPEFKFKVEVVIVVVPDCEPPTLILVCPDPAPVPMLIVFVCVVPMTPVAKL